MRQPFAHAMMALPSHDELTRQVFATCLRIAPEGIVFRGVSREVAGATLFTEPGEPRAFGALFGARKG